MSIHEPLRLLRIPLEVSNAFFGGGLTSLHLYQDEENKRARGKTDKISNNGDVSTAKGNLSVLEDKDLNEQCRSIMTPWIYTARNTDVSVISGLIDILRGWYRVLDPDAEIISRCVELIHISYLMLKDTETATSTRRGRPAAHSVLGVAETVHSAKLMTIKGIKELAKLKNSECMRILLDEIVRKSLPSRQNDNLAAPSLDAKISALHSNSGSIIRLINNLMAACSPLTSSEIPVIDHIIDRFARLYALRDDYANLVPVTTFPISACNNGLDSKIRSFYVALDEGKYSLLLFHALKVLPDDKGLLPKRIITHRGITGRFEGEHKPLVLEILRGCGSFEFVVKLIRDLQVEIMHDLDEVEVGYESFCLDGGVDGREREGDTEKSGRIKREIEVEVAGQRGSDMDVNGFRLLVQRLSL